MFLKVAKQGRSLGESLGVNRAKRLRVSVRSENNPPAVPHLTLQSAWKRVQL